MIRLGALMLATLAALFLVLSVWGQGNLRAERRPAPEPRPAAQEEGAPSPVAPPPQVTPAVVQAATQTPQQVQRFPGPALQPSPEHAGEAPAPVSLPDGPVLYVTGDRVNMRAGPSTGDRVVTALTRGAAVQPLGPTDAEWVNIRDPNGRTGYVAGRFLSQAAP
ncbi:SH3 domain-containing protein [Paracoccus sp. YIM 132242]|uniref:SH3 domain-containing protein n=1 Tax=Paracoccus lichenicola TaxID=2665644 RepID=A0A6L6HXQ2_9RHOB|nr:SH3 domain-containing protein [Paracoccus lichenicola]MTE02118.1 SH3 domain-containing protein [Paracoccus lichenicola]